MQRQLTPLIIFIALVLFPLSVHAQDVKLKNLGSMTTGTQTFDIDDVGKETFFFAIDVLFNTNGPRTFTATVNGETLKGKYKQKGTDDRKILFKLKSSAQKKLRRLLEASIADLGGFDDVDIDDLDIDKLEGKVNKARDALKIKGVLDFEGEADGDDGNGEWKFKTTGALLTVTAG